MVGAEFEFGLCPEDKLLGMVRDRTEKIQGQFHSERSTDAENSGEDSTVVLNELFWLFVEWSVMQSHRVVFLREELNTTAQTLMKQARDSNSACTIPERDIQTSSKMKGISRESNLHEYTHLTIVILSVLEDMQNIEKKLISVKSKFDQAISLLSEIKLESVKGISGTSLEDTVIHNNTHVNISTDKSVYPQRPSEDSCISQESYPEYVSHISYSFTQGHALQNTLNTEIESSAICDGMTSLQIVNESSNEGLSKRVKEKVEQKREDILFKMIRSSRNVGLGTHQDADGKKQPVEEPGENMEEVNKEDCVSCTQSWITVGLPDSASSSSEAICYITCPLEVIKLISCKVVDGLSSLLVSGSEELVSSVLRIEKPISTKCPFPITVAVPFQACYRGNYREVTVKVVDQEQRVSYVTPAATEGNYGGHRGSFAVVRVYTLGIFAVVSQFQRETFTIPKRGLSIKLSVDSRICLDYLPGSYNTPVVAQAMVQPVDTIMLSMLKSRNDSYYSILTTSPLLYLHHPSGLAPRRPLAITLPCPPNPDKKKTGEESNNGPGNTALIPDTFLYHQNRVLSAPGKSSKDLSKEQLVVLGWREEQWNLLDKTSVRNLQNSLVSFELMENFERVIVLRLLPSARPSDLTFFADNLEESVRTCSVTAVLHSRLQDPSSTVLAVLPSRELSWGLADLHVQNYRGPSEPSTEFFMKEGEQLLLKFSGNITSTDDQGTTPHTVTFHSQRRNWLHLKLKEKDPFGNYSSPHYKGTVLLFRIPRDQLFWRGDRVLIHQAYSLEEPVCKLSLTLPKEVKTLCRPMSAYILQHGQTESLCDKLLEWLCGELSEEDAALLVMCLQLRRSSVQLARLRAPDSFSLQTFHILTAWRRALPSSIPKRPLLARCLSRIGRAELAAELLRRDTAVEDGGSRDAETQRLN